jgi:hypothetical protein
MQPLQKPQLSVYEVKKISYFTAIKIISSLL